MLFQPAILALLLASAVTLTLLVAAAPFAVDIIRHWDIASGSERQLTLERRTYLFSTLLVFVFASQLVALLLFVFNADRMAEMFVGAMCAVGTLQVNAYGFPTLVMQTADFFLAAAWLTINHVDVRARDYPLVRVKYALLLGLLPVLALTLGLQFEYFSGLKADVMTSCCGSLFSGEAMRLAGVASGLPTLPSMVAFYAALALASLTAGIHVVSRRCGYWMGVASAGAFVATIVGVMSFLSLYIYEHPHHHCPFCVLKSEYNYQGYWLYLPLFAATAAGLGVAALRPFARTPSLRQVITATSVRLATAAGIGFILVAAIASWMIAHSNLVLLQD